MKQLVILHTPIEFPFEPYAPQIIYMEHIIHTLHRHGNCALEAQTGFGKSVCLFCATLGFERQFDEARRLLASALSFCEEELTFTQEVSELLRENLGWTKEELTMLEGFIEADTVLEKCVVARRVVSELDYTPQIVFLSRTHSELLEANRCLRNLHLGNIAIAYLGARENFCLNESAKALAQGQEIALSTVCKSLVKNRKCEFANTEDDAPTIDLEDVLVKGLASHKCPYFESRSGLRSEVILAPYQSLLDSAVREAVKNAIIIIDEAHNFEQAFKDEASTVFTLEDITKALKQLEIAKNVATELAASMPGGDKPTKSEMVSTAEDSAAFFSSKANLIEQAQLVLERVKCNCKTLLEHESEERVYECGDIFDGIRFETLIPQIKDLGAYCDYLVYNLRYDFKKFRSKAPYLFDGANAIWKQYEYDLLPRLFAIIEIGMVWQRRSDHDSFCVVFEKQEGQQQVSIHCLDIEVVREMLTQLNPHSMILTSATLSPMDSLEGETGLDFLVKASLPGIMRKGQVTVRVIDDQNLIGTYANRTPKYYQAACDCIQKCVLSNSHGGALVFLPSYEFLQEIKRMYKGVPAFFETDENAFDCYKKALSRRPALFAVARGSFSEGIDFSDDLCRMAIIVSIPFADVKSRLLIEERRWYDSHGKGLTGQAYYENLAFRTVNQCVGRVVRHKDDYGTVVLLDYRYTERRCRNKLPQWIDQELESVQATTFEPAAELDPPKPLLAPELMKLPSRGANASDDGDFTSGRPQLAKIFGKRAHPDYKSEFADLIALIKQIGVYDSLKQACKLAKSSPVESALKFIGILDDASRQLSEDEKYVFLASLEDAVLDEVVSRL